MKNVRDIESSLDDILSDRDKKRARLIGLEWALLTHGPAPRRKAMPPKKFEAVLKDFLSYIGARGEKRLDILRALALANPRFGMLLETRCPPLSHTDAEVDRIMNELIEEDIDLLRQMEDR